ncbi:hypothetical protein [Rhizobium sp. SYY.PMSO]|uniref:hypothetical protein n=1 Tax=Rhizobium sp. SYY.PMSO TaxID=3382192 RepID=UPI0039900237
MSNGRPGLDNLENQFFRDSMKALDLIANRKSDSGFVICMRRLLGNNPQKGKSFRIAKREHVYAGVDKSRVIFLPAQWREEFDKTKSAWAGCENWWAGYPFILWVEIRLGDDGTTGYLKLIAEIGPISNYKVRKGIIDTIRAAASAKNLERIQFPADAADKGRLYSRFFTKNSITVNDIRDPDEMERKFMQLVADFEAEFDLIASAIPQLLEL